MLAGENFYSDKQLFDIPESEVNLSKYAPPTNENNTAVRVIGLSGAAGAGKSTVAAFLNELFGFERVRFAGPLKDMLRQVGLTEDEIEGDRKELPCELLAGKTPRQAMQLLGTEWGRQLIGQDFWVRAWGRRAHQHPAVVAEDVRFQNEADAIHEMGGIVVRIDCSWARSATGAGHASERPVDFQDYVVANTTHGDVGPLLAQIADIVVR